MQGRRKWQLLVLTGCGLGLLACSTPAVETSSAGTGTSMSASGTGAAMPPLPGEAAPPAAESPRRIAYELPPSTTVLEPLPTAVVLLAEDQPERNREYCKSFFKTYPSTAQVRQTDPYANIVRTSWPIRDASVEKTNDAAKALKPSDDAALASFCDQMVGATPATAAYDYAKARRYLDAIGKQKAAGPVLLVMTGPDPTRQNLIVDASGICAAGAAGAKGDAADPPLSCAQGFAALNNKWSQAVQDADTAASRAATATASPNPPRAIVSQTVKRGPRRAVKSRCGSQAVQRIRVEGVTPATTITINQDAACAAGAPSTPAPAATPSLAAPPAMTPAPAPVAMAASAVAAPEGTVHKVLDAVAALCVMVERLKELRFAKFATAAVKAVLPGSVIVTGEAVGGVACSPEVQKAADNLIPERW